MQFSYQNHKYHYKTTKIHHFQLSDQPIHLTTDAELQVFGMLICENTVPFEGITLSSPEIPSPYGFFLKIYCQQGKTVFLSPNFLSNIYVEPFGSNSKSITLYLFDFSVEMDSDQLTSNWTDFITEPSGSYRYCYQIYNEFYLDQSSQYTFPQFAPHSYFQIIGSCIQKALAYDDPLPAIYLSNSSNKYLFSIESSINNTPPSLSLVEKNLLSTAKIPESQFLSVSFSEKLPDSFRYFPVLTPFLQNPITYALQLFLDENISPKSNLECLVGIHMAIYQKIS